MGSLLFSPSASLVLFFLFPFSASARGGGGRGRGGGGFDFGGVSSSGGGDNGNGLASFYLEPLDATIFAFAVIFAAVSLYQGYIAARNIRRRILKIPPSISLPEFSVGPIFPACLIMFAIFQMTAYILQAIYWGLTYNENTTNHPDFSYAYVVAMGAMGFLADNFLVAGILALLFRRETVLVNTSRTILDIKMVADAILVVILFALSMGHVGIEEAGQLSFQNAKVWYDLGLAYESFFFIAVVDVAISSIVLFVRTRQLPFKENFVRASCVANLSLKL
ncbi:hypothetical protein AN958_01084 [Leucoagaricus sp. SymC.cos]|nr:hypothetical protein AN958_01084 [Leucoagaricus sp. SymC.cos]